VSYQKEAVSRRTYDSSGRRSTAARTQAHVVAVATRLMIEDGYARTSIPDVAAAAGVSVALVYAAFSNKAGLLKRVLDTAVAGDDDPVAIRDRPEVAAVAAAASGKRRCVLTAQIIAGANSRTAPLARVLRDAAGNDVDAAMVLDRAEAGRHAGMREFVDLLAGAGQLRDGMEPVRAADIVWVLSDPLTYGRLVEDRGWSHADYEEWLASSIYDAIGQRKRHSS